MCHFTVSWLMKWDIGGRVTRNHDNAETNYNPTSFTCRCNNKQTEGYLAVDQKTGSVRVWCNYGPDGSWDDGWKFAEGGDIASGIAHTKLQSPRFLDSNVDYVCIGKGGFEGPHEYGFRWRVGVTQGDITTGISSAAVNPRHTKLVLPTILPWTPAQAPAAWLHGCWGVGKLEKKYYITAAYVEFEQGSCFWAIFEHEKYAEDEL